jgi:hypothetical protein
MLLYVIPLPPCLAQAPVGTLSYGKSLYMSSIQLQPRLEHQIMPRRGPTKSLLDLTVEANRRAVFSSITLPKDIV